MPRLWPDQASIDHAEWTADAIRRIEKQYGHTVSVWEKGKALLKFGRNPNVDSGAYSTIWATGIDAANETYLAAGSNAITHYSSASTADAQTGVVEGHTSDTNGNLTFVTQTITLTGQTPAALTTALNRSTRLNNTGATNFVGPVYVYEGSSSVTAGKPTTAARIHLTVPAGLNNSEKASTSISSVDYWLITEFYADLLEKAANAFVDVKLEIRPKGQVFREVADLSVTSTNSHGVLDIRPYIIAPANSDVRISAIGGTDNLDVSGGINGMLATIVS